MAVSYLSGGIWNRSSQSGSPTTSFDAPGIYLESGVDRILVVTITTSVASGTAPGASSVSLGASALTKIGSSANNGLYNVDQWYIVNPPVAPSQHLTGTFSTACEWGLSYSLLDGVDQSSPIDANNNAATTSSSTTATASVTVSTAGSYLLDGIVSNGSPSPNSVDGSNSINFGPDHYVQWEQHYATGSASITYTVTNATKYAYKVTALKAKTSYTLPAVRHSYAYDNGFDGLAHGPIDTVTGDLIIVAVQTPGTLIAVTVHDNATGGTNTYSQAGTGHHYTADGNNSNLYLFYAFAKSTERVFVATSSLTGGDGNMSIQVVGGITNSLGAVLGTYAMSHETGTASASHTSNSLTVTSPNTYLFSWWYWNTSDQIINTASDGSSKITETSFYHTGFGRFLTSAGSYTQAVTGDITNPHYGNIVAAFYGTFTGTKTQTAVSRLAKTITKTQSSTARLGQSKTKTQSATAKTSVSPHINQSATARLIRTITKTQSATARMIGSRTKTQAAKATIIQTKHFTQTAGAYIVQPPEIPTTYTYKSYRNGKYLGDLPNVTTPFALSQDINTVGSQITIEVGVSVDVSYLPATENITDESGDPITDEDGNPLITEGAINIVGIGGDTSLIKNGNKILVWEYSKWHPNGICVLRGEIERWEAAVGNDVSAQGIRVLIYSDGKDTDEHLVIGSPFVAEVEQTTGTNSLTLQETSTDKLTSWTRAAQTVTTDPAQTNIAAVGVKLTGSATPVDTTVKLYPTIADASAGTNLLASSVKTVVDSTSTPTEYVFGFSSPVESVGDTQYCYTVTSAVGKSIIVHYRNTNIYADGDMYTALFDGVTGSATYAITPSGGVATLSDMWFRLYSSAGETTAVFEDADPSTDMLTESIDHYNTEGGLLTYTEDSIDATGLSLPYTFNTQTVYEAMGIFLNLAPSGYYFYVDLGSNILNFKQASTDADITVTKGWEMESLLIVATIENVKNKEFVIGGKVGGVNLFKVYQDAASDDEFGTRIDRHVDTRVVLTSTSDAIGQSFVASNKDEQFQTVVTLLARNIDLNTVKPGKIINFRGFGGFVDGLKSQIVRVDRSRDMAVCTLGVLPPRVSLSLERITRNLLAQQTVDNPTSPS